MKRSTADRLKLPVKGKFIAFAVAGVPPRVMGIGMPLAMCFVVYSPGPCGSALWLICDLLPAPCDIGPAFAIPKCIHKAGLKSVHDVDLYEFNEAFASQATYCAFSDRCGFRPGFVFAHRRERIHPQRRRCHSFDGALQVSKS